MAALEAYPERHAQLVSYLHGDVDALGLVRSPQDSRNQDPRGKSHRVRGSTSTARHGSEMPGSLPSTPGSMASLSSQHRAAPVDTPSRTQVMENGGFMDMRKLPQEEACFHRRYHRCRVDN